MDIESLRAVNPGQSILEPRDARLVRYGRILEIPGVQSLVSLADSLAPANLDANVYAASVPELEAHAASACFGPRFGFCALQVGYNAGPNSRLNGLEWHKSPEIMVAVTDLALFLGRAEDIDWSAPSGPRYDSARLLVLCLPKASALEIFPGTTHLSPCRLSCPGFKSVVVLPKGTNAPLLPEERELAASEAARGNAEARLLFARNKWLLAHPERRLLVDQGAHPGITGENRELRF